MKNVLWLIVGVGAGFVAAHYVSRTARGKAFFEDIDSKAREFGDAVLDGYRERVAELQATVAEAEDVIADLSERVK
ncbi:hypothetical protein BH11ACT2_BH11ACT2_07380 [soil metagenome]